jgi:hypothetical protein
MPADREREIRHAALHSSTVWSTVAIELLAELDRLREDARALAMEYDEVLDSACTGLREPMTLDDARRVQAMLTHHHVERKKASVRAARSGAPR